MNKVLALVLVLLLGAVAVIAQEGEHRIVIPTESSGGSKDAVVCCTPVDFKPGEICAQVRRYQAQGESASLLVADLCDDLRKDVAREWLVSAAAQPGEVLYRIDCEAERAWRPGGTQPTASASPSTVNKNPPASAPPASGGKGKPAAPEKANSNLKELEKTISEQKKLIQSLRQDLDKLGVADKELEKKLKALEEAQKKSCIRIEDNFKGREEVMIAVGGSILRFLHVRPQSDKIPIGLSEAKAGEFLAEAQAESNTKIFPHIYLAVPEAVREVRPFFLQDRLIDGDMYRRLTGGKDAGRVSYEDVSRFIEDLNTRCEGRAKFALPTEEQFVAVAHESYQPLVVGLKPCELLRHEDRLFPFAELLGHSWQLTSSRCQPFSDPPKMTCADNRSYIRKGGASSSANPLECMPEFRSSAPFDVQQKETSFRLALAD